MLQQNVSLKPYNTLALDVSARTLVTVVNVQDMLRTIKHFNSQIELVIGGGSNIVLCHDIDGVVVVNRIKGIAVSDDDPDGTKLVVGAGENWDDFVRFCVERNLWGVENLAAIPGTVGAAPIQNIGAYGVEIESVIDWVEVIRKSDATLHRLNADECGFGYRQSHFKTCWREEMIIVRVAINLSKKPQPQLRYGELRHAIQDIPPVDITTQLIYDTVSFIRASKLPDPTIKPNVGSFFKNPLLTPKEFDELAAKYGKVPHYPQTDGSVKVAAGWLIEQAGWKNRATGAAAVHDKQALVLINRGGATGRDILDLAEAIQKDILSKFSVQLEIEPHIV